MSSSSSSSKHSLKSSAQSVQTLYDTLHTNQQEFHNHPAIIIPPTTKQSSTIQLTYQQLSNEIHSVTSKLHSYGIQQHDAICMSLLNSIEFTICFLSITCMRCWSAPLNYNYGVDEFQFYLKDINAKAMLIHRRDAFPSSIYSEKQREYAIKAARSVNAAIIEVWWENNGIQMNMIEQGKLQKKKQQSKSDSKNITLKPQSDDICLILHTSGTTSKPKAVPLTHKSISTSIRNIAATYHLTPYDRTYLVMPLFHVHGLIGALLTTLGVGGSVVIPPKFSASIHWKQFHTYMCTWYSAVPTIHNILLEYENQFNGQKSRGKLRFIRSCSSPLSESGFHKLQKTYQVPICEAYAMTEASHQMTSNPLQPTPNAKQIVNSVGKPTGVHVTIRNNHDHELKQGEAGEVCIKGDNVTPGYLNNEKANKENFTPSGWFRTGDQGYFNEEGYLFLTGRLKEFINRGGEKISPIEVDNAIMSHPDVAEAVAFPKQSDMYGQEVCAAVVLKDEAAKKYENKEEEIIKILQQHAASKVARFKVPTRIFITQNMPKTSTGKIQRRKVADAFLKDEKNDKHQEKKKKDEKPKSKL